MRSVLFLSSYKAYCKYVILFVLICFTIVQQGNSLEIILANDLTQTSFVYDSISNITLVGNGYSVIWSDCNIRNSTLYIQDAILFDISSCRIEASYLFLERVKNTKYVSNTILSSSFQNTNGSLNVDIQYNVDIRDENTDWNMSLPMCTFRVTYDVPEWIQFVAKDNMKLFNHTRANNFICFDALYPPANEYNSSNVPLVVENNSIHIESNYESSSDEISSPYTNSTNPFMDGMWALNINRACIQNDFNCTADGMGPHYHHHLRRYDTYIYLRNTFPNGLIPSKYQLYKSFISISLNNVTIPNMRIVNNGYTANASLSTNTTTTTTTNLKWKYDGLSEFYFRMDSMLHIHGYSSVSAAQITNVYVNSSPDYFGQSRAAIRAGLVFTGGNLDALNRFFPTLANTPKEYQYVARHIRDQYNPNLNAFQSDVEIEPSLTDDELGGYRGDLCHYRVRGDRPKYCVLLNPNMRAREFSIQTDGECYGLTNTESVSQLECGYETLFVKTPFENTETGIFSSRNLFGGKKLDIRVYNTSEGQAFFSMDPNLVVTSKYASAFGDGLNANSVFPTYKPFVIATTQNISRVDPLLYNRNEEFGISIMNVQDIHFRFNYTAGNNMGGTLFTLVRYQNTSGITSTNNPTWVDEIQMSFENCTIVSNYLDPSPTARQSIDLHFIEIQTTGLGLYTSDSRWTLLANVTQLTFRNVIVHDIGKLIRGSYAPFSKIHNLIIENVYASHMTNGLLETQIGADIRINNLACIQCYIDITSKKALSIIGSYNDLSSYVKNVVFNTTTYTDVAGASRTFSFENFVSLDIRQLQSTEFYGSRIGIYHRGLLNYPCTKLSNAFLKNLNFDIHGMVYDVYCDLPNILGCSGYDCIYDVDFIPNECYVVPSSTVNVRDRYYSIIYFTTYTEACARCRARNSLGDRLIYGLPGIHVENNIVCENRNITYEYTKFICNATIETSVNNDIPTQKCVIFGNSHSISKQIGTVGWVGFEFRGFLFVNTKSLFDQTNTQQLNTDIASYLLRVTATSTVNVDYLAIQDTDIVSQLPVINTTISATLQQPTSIGLNSVWTQFVQQTMFSSNTIPRTVIPNIISPNTELPLSLERVRNVLIKNVRILGSKSYCMMALRSTSTGIASNLTMENVVFENCWGGAFDVFAYSHIIAKDIIADYMTAGYNATLRNPYGSRLSLDNTINGASIRVDGVRINTLSTLIPTPTTNPYVSPDRLVYGNPFMNPLTPSLPIGYLRMFILENIAGSNVKSVSLRKIQIGDSSTNPIASPIGIELSNCDRTAMALNDAFFPPKIVDARLMMREFVRSNIGGFIHGYYYDVRSTSYMSDINPPAELFCNDGCLPTSDNYRCRASVNFNVTYPASLYDYKDIDTMWIHCPANDMELLDSTYTVSMGIYNLQSLRAPAPTSALRMYSTRAGGSTIVGKMKFVQSSPNQIDETPPASISFQNIEFKYTPSAGIGEIGIEFVSDSNSDTSLILSTITITNCRVTVNVSALEGSISTDKVIGIACVGCLAHQFILNNIVYSVVGGTYGYVVMNVYNPIQTHITDNKIIMSGDHTVGTTTSTTNMARLIEINFAHGFLITRTNLFDITCNYNVVGCIAIVGTSTLWNNSTRTIDGIILRASVGGLEDVKGSAIYYESDESGLNVTTIALNYMAHLKNIRTIQFPNVGIFATPDLLSVNPAYPNSTVPCQPIQTIPISNPLTRGAGLNHDWVFDEYPSYTILVDTNANPSEGATKYFPFLSEFGCDPLNAFSLPSWDPATVAMILLIFSFVGCFVFVNWCICKCGAIITGEYEVPSFPHHIEQKLQLLQQQQQSVGHAQQPYMRVNTMEDPNQLTYN